MMKLVYLHLLALLLFITHTTQPVFGNIVNNIVPTLNDAADGIEKLRPDSQVFHSDATAYINTVANDRDDDDRVEVQRLVTWFIKKAEDSTGNDATAGIDEVWAEADRRAERLEQIVETTKYEIAHAARKKALGPAARTLTDIVNTIKAAAKKVENEPSRQSIQHLNTYNIGENETVPAWMRFKDGITADALYSDDDGVIDELLADLRDVTLWHIENIGGSQFHFIYKLMNGGTALFKPQRSVRDYERPIDLDIYYDLERHTAEIASFHLDRILGFRYVPPVAGRRLHIWDDIYHLGGVNVTGKTYTSVDDHLCFNGKCEANCDHAHLICADDDKLLEGSMTAFFPLRLATEFANPFCPVCGDCKTAEATHYHKHTKFAFGSDFCPAVVRRTPPFDNDRSFMRLVDAHIFDFLIGNRDRHHIYAFDKQFGNGTFFALFDNGKGFGTSERDELKLLAPLYQCCMVRASTVDSLLQLHTGPDRLSTVMRRSLQSDLLQNVLTEAHLAALDRRLAIVLQHVNQCVENSNGQHDVIIDDRM